MSDGPGTSERGLSRRNLLKGGLAIGGTAAAGLAGLRSAAAAPAGGDPAITEIQDWNRYLGEGVWGAPCGTPAPCRTDVVWR